MIIKIQKRHDALLKKLTEQSASIDQKVDAWKFSYPELSLYIETKKRTMEKTLNHVKQALQQPESIESLDVLDKRLDDVESLFASLQQDFKPRWRKAIEGPSILLLIVFLLRSFIFSVHCISSPALEPTLLRGDRVLINKLAHSYDPIQRGDLIAFDNPEVPYRKRWSKEYIWQRFIGIKFDPLGLPAGPEQVIRRVIALPGDTIEGKVESGVAKLYLNGDLLTENYLNTYPLIATQKDENKEANAYLTTIQAQHAAVKQTSEMPIMWVTYVPDIPYEEQPYYKIDVKDIPLNPKTHKPLLTPSGAAGSYDLFKPVQVPQGKYWCMGDNRKNSSDSRSWGLIDESLIQGRATMILYSIDTRETTWALDALKDPIVFCSKRLRSQRFFKNLINPMRR